MDMKSAFEVRHEALRKQYRITQKDWMGRVQGVIEESHVGCCIFFGPHDFRDFQRLLLAEHGLRKVESIWNTCLASQAVVVVIPPQGNTTFWYEDHEDHGRYEILMVTKARIQTLETQEYAELKAFHNCKTMERSTMKQIYSITAHWKDEYESVSSPRDATVRSDGGYIHESKVNAKLRELPIKPADRRRNRWAKG